MAVLMVFLLFRGERRSEERNVGAGSRRLRPLQQVLIRLVPALCSVCGCLKVTADSPLALHKPLPENVVSLEGIFSPPVQLAASYGGDDVPSGALSGWSAQSKTCHLLLVH